MVHLFPPSSLDNSILTAVLVGVLVVWFFQETLGWNFTGLVVPGYLGAILVIQPVTGAVIVLEAVVTWLAFTAISDQVPRWWPWSPLFGRDRFFGLLLLSVAVRIALEGGGFAWMQTSLGVAVDRDLHSMSLVVVPLAANALWRTGFLASLTRIGVPVVVTWAILEVVLLRFTNLSLSSFELTYEDLALDFVSSPRAYILLLTGAWLGSSANNRWGWDYGGIIVPGLLAICWLEPTRLLATLGEAFAIATLVPWVARLPGLANANLTGGRPLVLAFTLGYLLKFTLGWTLGGLWPGLAIRELFGFGYLLPTMIALRVLRAGDDPFRPIVPAVVTSFAGFVVGSALGYGLAVALPAPAPPRAPLDSPDQTTLSLALLAWGNRGPVPDLAGAVDATGVEGLVWGGEGFGALWVRPRGAALAVTARVGAYGMPAALASVARATDARVVLLCAEQGPECAMARSQLARRMPVLEVTGGGRTVLTVAGRLPASIRTAELASVVGPVAVEAGEGGTVLVLSSVARLRAAAEGVGRPVGPLEADSLLAALVPSDGLPPPALRVMAEEVIAPWMAWRRGDPGADDALSVAAGMAALLGLEVTASGDRSALVGPGFRVLLDRRGVARVVTSEERTPDGHTAAVARAIGAALGAAAVVEDAPPGLLQLEASDVARPAHAALIGVMSSLGSDAVITTVRGARDGRDAGADFVRSLGRPSDAAEADPPLDRLAEAIGVSSSTYDGSFARAWMQDSGNSTRDIGFAAAGKHAHSTVFVGPDTRRRLGGGADGTPLAPLVASGAIPQDTVDLAEISSSVHTPDASWETVREAAHRLVAFGGGRELGALRALGRVSAVRDPILGLRWLGVERCDRPVCETLLVPVRGPCPTCAPGNPALLAVGAADWVVTRGAAP